MSSPFYTRPLVCQEMIGCEQELDILRAALAEAAAGQSRFIWLAGEAGLGKSRLSRTFARIARVQQATVLFGQAFSRDSVLPFSLFLDLVQRQFTPQAQTVGSPEQLVSFKQALLSAFPFSLKYLPDLAALFPGITPPVFEDGTAMTSGQKTIFHRVFWGLHTLAALCPPPLVFILDNLHLADETSLYLLEFLVQRFGAYSTQENTSPALLVLGTYRPEALSTVPLLRTMLFDEHNTRHVRTLPLQPWNLTEHRMGINSILEQQVPEEFSDFLFAWDEGNPFFTEELLSAMMASGQIQARSAGWKFPSETPPTLPVSLTVAIIERFRRLSESDRDVLATAAVIGRFFDFSLLASVCARQEHELVLVLQRARDAQLIGEIEQGAGSGVPRQELYLFRHLLTREAIYASLLQSERRLKHRAVAETVEKLLAENNSELASTRLISNDAARLLAEHYTLAGLAERARSYALQEAERAHQVSAFREECYYLDMAQASLPTHDPMRLSILKRLGGLTIGTYDFARALHWFSQARAGYLQLGQTSQALEILAAMAIPAWFLGSSLFPSIRAVLEMAVEEAFASPDGTADLGVLAAASSLAAYRFVLCSHRQTVQQTTRSRALYAALADPRKENVIPFNAIADLWARANLPGADIPACLAEFRHVLSTTIQRNLYNEAMGAYVTLLALLIFWGRIGEAEQLAEETLEFEGRYGPLHIGFFLGWKYFYAGQRWDEGITLLTTNLAYRREKGFVHLGNIEGVALAHLLLARHDLARASIYLHEARADLSTADEHLPLLWLNWGLAKLSYAEGKIEQAQQWYARTLALWQTAEDTLFILPVLLDGIAFYTSSHDPVHAEAWLVELRALAALTSNPLALAALQEAEGLVAVLQRRFQLALEHMRQAVAAWETLQFRYQYARAAQRLAELLLQHTQHTKLERFARQREREEAEMLFSRALEVYVELGLVAEQQAIATLRARTHLEAQRKRRQTMRADQHLTPREMDVLRLLVAGKSNKEIAQELHIQPGTAEIHVAHILTKLQCETRTQAALFAVAQGWIKVSGPL